MAIQFASPTDATAFRPAKPASAARHLFLPLFFSLLAPALAPAADQRTPVRSLLEMRQANVVIQKWDISCGAAALATLMTYQLRDPVPEKTIATAMLAKTNPALVKARQGFSLLDLKRFVETRHYQGNGYTGLEMRDLIKMNPAIVPVQFHGYPHFIVFKGMQGNRVLIADPAFGNRVLSLDDFQKAWVDKIAFVVTRRGNTQISKTE